MYLRLKMMQLPKDRSYGDVIRTIMSCFHGYKLERFAFDLGPELMLTHDQWFQVMDPAFRDKILEYWVKFDVGFDLVIGSFAHNSEFNGQAFLLSVSGQEGKIAPVNFPGVVAIGTGAENANFWLNYRKHKLGYSLKRAAYHAYEAKLMAEKSAHVNERIEVLIASVGGRHFYLRQEQKSIKDCPVSLPALERMYKKYGPRETGGLDPTDQASKLVY